MFPAGLAIEADGDGTKDKEKTTFYWNSLVLQMKAKNETWARALKKKISMSFSLPWEDELNFASLLDLSL